MEGNLYRQGNLTALGERSGGRAIVNANEAEVLVRGIYDESQSYYTLAFQSSSTAADGRFHAINVRVNRRDAASARQEGTLCAGARRRARCRRRHRPAARSGPCDRARVAERRCAARDGRGRVRRSVWRAAVRGYHRSVDGRRSARNGADGGLRSRGPLGELALAGARSRTGARGRRPSRRTDLLSRLPLEPGRYEIRAAVRDERGAKLGTIASYVDVPDFAQSPLSLSDVVLEVTPAPLAAPSSIFAAALPVVPSAQRTFAAADRVRAFVRVYQGRGRVEPVTLTATIQDDRGKAVLDKKELLTPDMFGTERVADYLLDVPLESATAGTYRLRIVATRDARQASRDVRFVVEPTRRPPS